MVGIGIVGTGLMGAKHAASLRGVDGARLVSVAAARVEDAAAVAEEHGVPAVAFEAMLADDAVDAVVVATPTDTHVEIACAAMAAGKDVLVEKPVARDLDGARTIAEAARTHGRLLAVGHVLRCFPEYASLHAAVERGDVGRVAVATLGRQSAKPDWASDDWHSSAERSGGVLLDMTVHDIDMARWCFGEPVRGQCRTLGPDTHGGLDYALATIVFEDGPLVHLHASWAEPGGFAQMAEFCGSRGMLRYDSREGVELDVLRHQGAVATGALPATGPDDRDGYAIQLGHFVEAVQRGSIPAGTVLADGDWALRTLEVALGLLEASRLRAAVSLRPGQAGTPLEAAAVAGGVA